jgi:hypothetical protein
LQKVAPKWDDFLPTHRKRNGITEFMTLFVHFRFRFQMILQLIYLSVFVSGILGIDLGQERSGDRHQKVKGEAKKTSLSEFLFSQFLN